MYTVFTHCYMLVDKSAFVMIMTLEVSAYTSKVKSIIYIHKCI